MSKKTEVVALAKSVCNDNSHGYDQANRWGPDYDCSSFIITIWESVGVKVKSSGASYTGNMRQVFLNNGFEDVTARVNLATGSGLESADVLLNQASHTAIYIGGGMIAHASINEFGKTVGGISGDQTGKEICTRTYYNYPWDCVLRYKETSSDHTDTDSKIQNGTVSGDAIGGTITKEPEVVNGIYTVKSGDTLIGIAKKVLGDGNRYGEIQKLNGLVSTIIYVGQKLKIPVEGESAAKILTHTVKSGDTLWGIAQLYLGNGARYKEIMQFNNLSSDAIRIGQVLKIPEK